MITKVQLSGLTCQACEKVIKNRLKKINDVQDVQVSINDGQIIILSNRPIKNEEIVKVLINTQYKLINNS